MQKRAALVAALHGGHERGHRGAAPSSAGGRRGSAGAAVSNTVRATGGAPRQLLEDERGELGDVVGPDDEVDVPDPREERSRPPAARRTRRRR